MGGAIANKGRFVMCATAAGVYDWLPLKCYEKVSKKQMASKADNALSAPVLLYNTPFKAGLISLINNLYTQGSDRTLTTVLL